MYIESGPTKILDSGQVTTFAGADLHFAFEVDEVPFTFEMVFETDPAVDDVAVHVTQTERGLVLQCVNFDKPDGRGSAVPVALGEVGEFVVFVHFRVSRYGTSVDRTVHYTFYAAPRSVLD